MTIFRKSLVAAVFLGGATIAQAEFTGNIGVTSDYVWRGISQTAEQASVSGGLDYADDSGFYVGTWVGSLGDTVSEFGGAEVDLYIGFGQEYDLFTWDVGYIYYYYPSNDDIDFGEIYGSIGVGIWSIGLAFTTNGQGDSDDGDLFDTGDLYIHTGLSGPLSETWSLGGTLGLYTFDTDGVGGVGADYAFGQLDLSKSSDFGDFTISAIITDADNDDFAAGLEQFGFNPGDDDLKLVVSWGIGF